MHRIRIALVLACACAAATSADAQQSNPSGAAAQTWYWCIGGKYVSSVFAASPRDDSKKGFGAFLKKTYGFSGPTQCYAADSAGDAQVSLKRQIGEWQSVVHTGWPSGAEAPPH